MLYRGSIFRRDFIQNLIQTKEKDHSSGASQSREKKVSLVLRNNSVFVFREKTSLFPDRPQKNQSQNRSLNQLKNQSQSRILSQKQNQRSLKRVPRKSKSHFEQKNYLTIDWFFPRSTTKAPMVAKVAPSLKDGEEDLSGIYGDLDPSR